MYFSDITPQEQSEWWFYEKNVIDESLMLGNRAAAIAVQQLGTYILTEEDVKKILH